MNMRGRITLKEKATVCGEQKTNYNSLPAKHRFGTVRAFVSGECGLSLVRLVKVDLLQASKVTYEGAVCH